MCDTYEFNWFVLHSDRNAPAGLRRAKVNTNSMNIIYAVIQRHAARKQDEYVHSMLVWNVKRVCETIADYFMYHSDELTTDTDTHTVANMMALKKAIREDDYVPEFGKNHFLREVSMSQMKDIAGGVSFPQ